MQKIELPIEKNEASPSNPDFVWGVKMLFILIIFLLFSYIILLLFSKIIVSNISLDTEKKWFWDKFVNQTKFDYNKYSNYKIKEFKNYNFYISDSPEINAYALLWWNIEITSGFLENIENQEELIFVMAHEIWHIKNRDILKSLSTKIPMQLTLTFLWFDIWIWNDMIFNVFSKKTELDADKYWMKILKKYKINPLCVIPFFTRDHNFSDSVMEMMSDHPLNSSRIKNLENLAKEMWFKNKKNCKKIK